MLRLNKTPADLKHQRGFLMVLTSFDGAYFAATVRCCCSPSPSMPRRMVCPALR